MPRSNIEDARTEVNSRELERASDELPPHCSGVWGARLERSISKLLSLSPRLKVEDSEIEQLFGLEFDKEPIPQAPLRTPYPPWLPKDQVPFDLQGVVGR
jgi:hypothetical protein